MRYDRKTQIGFKIATPIDPEWGFRITVEAPTATQPRQTFEYHLGQQVRYSLGSVNGESDSEVYYCIWELSDHHSDVVLNGKLVAGRTDPFAPLMKCLAFLEAKHGGEE